MPFFAGLERAISHPRIEGYRPPNGSDFDAAVNYFWNIALCESLYPSLNALEITLRNSVHRAATNVYQNAYWFNQAGVLNRGQPDQVRKALKRLSDRGRSHTDGRIIAELGFGFWTTLLSDPYHSSFWMPQRAKLLKAAFPHMTNATRVRGDIHRRYDTQRYLRNRVFHFEPVWNGVPVQIQQTTTILNVRDMHGEAIEAIGWISPTTRDSVLLIDHFDDTYSNGKARIDADLRQRFNLS